MARARQPAVRRERRALEAERVRLAPSSVAAIIVWVLSLAGAWYGVQSKLSEIQSDVRNISTRMDGDSKLAERDATTRDLRIRELENLAKSYDIRIRQLENENARRGAR